MRFSCISFFFFNLKRKVKLNVRNLIYFLCIQINVAINKFSILCSFSDRGKRLKLQQFIAKKADALYDKTNLETTAEPIKQQLGDEGKNLINLCLITFYIFSKIRKNFIFFSPRLKYFYNFSQVKVFLYVLSN